ncbi:hypothetical protein I4U23_022046 [Adineta vaga]|nr:hypothetical protein I4U23_022046 [Adineta vaga]
MNELQCGRNIDDCLNFYNLTLCSLENNTCVENHGFCVFNDKIQPKCVCLPCFIGEHCEEDRISRNLWQSVLPHNEIATNGAYIPAIIVLVWGAFLLLNGIFCLQTYLCRKIRETNLGIYLIMLSIVSIFIGLIVLIFASLALHIKELPQPLLFADLYCLIYGKFLYIPLVSMYNWFIACVAIERALVTCSKNYELHDSRRRSILVSIVIIIICPLSMLPGTFTVRQNQSAELRPVQCMNFTPFGYILHTTITCIHLLAFYLLYIIMNILVLGYLLKHRRRFVVADSLSAQIYLILRKHKDFFIPYLVQALTQLPHIIMGFITTCSMASTSLATYLFIIFLILQILPFLITFYLYIYLSPIYWIEFLYSSPIGKCLMKSKEKMRNAFHHNTVNNIELSQMRY